MREDETLTIIPRETAEAQLTKLFEGKGEFAKRELLRELTCPADIVKFLDTLHSLDFDARISATNTIETLLMFYTESSIETQKFFKNIMEYKK